MNSTQAKRPGRRPFPRKKRSAGNDQQPDQKRSRTSSNLPPALEKKVWLEFEKSDGNPVCISDISNNLKLSVKHKRQVRRFLQTQVRADQLIALRRGRFALPKRYIDSKSLSEGVFQVSREGHASVRLEEDGRSIWIPPERCHGAIHGDLIRVKVEQRQSGKHIATVISTTEAFSGRMLGLIERNRGVYAFIPENTRYPRIPLKSEDLEGLEQEPKQGDWAIGRLSREQEGRPCVCIRLCEVLGKTKGPELDQIGRLVELGLEDFSPEVIDESIAVANEPEESDFEGRVDLRQTTLVTIDGQDARDFDDAVALVKLPDGKQRLIVAIADVAEYVKLDSALDRESFERATSVYFPASCVPMLPESLSNNICSLREGVDRLSLVIYLDYKGSELVHTELHEAVIRSHGRLTYHQVSEVLESDGTSIETDQNPAFAFEPMLEDMAALAKELRKQRMARGSLDFDFPEAEVVFTDDGEIADIRKADRKGSHWLIEEFMLQANQAVANFLLKRGLPGIYRNHGAPSSEKVLSFLGLLHSYEPSLAAELMKRLRKQPFLAQDAGFFSDCLAKLKDHPAERTFQQMLLRSLQQAVYEAESVGHFGLAMKRYLHFTSPIRRYPDLCVHRVVKAYLRGEISEGSAEISSWKAVFAENAEQSSSRERLAMKAEREVMARYQARLMKDKIGEEFEGVITGLSAFGFFVELDRPFVTGLVHQRSFDHPLNYDQEHLRLSNDYTGECFRLGQKVRICVESVSVDRGDIDFSLCR